MHNITALNYLALLLSVQGSLIDNTGDLLSAGISGRQ